MLLLTLGVVVYHHPNCAASDAACFACEMEAEYADYLRMVVAIGGERCLATALSFNEYAEMANDSGTLWL